MLDINLTVDDNSQYFTTPRKHDHSSTVPSSKIPLVSDPPQCHHNITTYMTHQKVLPSGKEYIYFKLMEELPEKHSVINQGH